MHSLAKRCLGYGLATPIVAALCYGGFFYEVPPDPEHFLTQAEIKLRFAARLPAHRRDGAEVPARASMIADALQFVDRAEQISASTARTVEYRAFADYLRGNAKAAAAGYSKARTLAESSEQRGELALCEARMLALAGDDQAALPLLDAAISLCSRAIPSARLERARILQRQQHNDDALAAARSVLDLEHATGDDLIETGQVLETLSRSDIASTAYCRAAEQTPIANYFAARLKVKAGEVDKALEMLERAQKDTGASVRALVEREPATWQSLAGTTRFRRLFPEMEAAQPGR